MTDVIIIPDIEVTPHPRPPKDCKDLNIPVVSLIDPKPYYGPTGYSGSGGNPGTFQGASMPPVRQVSIPPGAPPPRVHHKCHSHRKHPELVPDLAPNGLKINITPAEMSLLVALGVLFLPEGAIAAAAYGMNVMSLGLLSEFATLEVMMSPASMALAQRAGVLIGSGKALSVFGIFESRPDKVMNSATVRLLKKRGPDWVINKAKQIGIGFNKNDTVLWAGFGDGVMVSQKIAESLGKKTLEMTPGGAWLNSLGLWSSNTPFTLKEIQYIWQEISLHAMMQVEGKVLVLKGAARHESIVHEEIKLLRTRGIEVEVAEYLPVIRYKK